MVVCFQNYLGEDYRPKAEVIKETNLRRVSKDRLDALEQIRLSREVYHGRGCVCLLYT